MRQPGRAVDLPPAELHALSKRSLEAGFDSLANHRPLEFSKGASYLENELAHRGRRVDDLLVAHMHSATFLFATTRASDVDAAFTSRCDEIQLREYSEAEVARILKWKVPHDEWADDVYLALARLGRCVPRISIQLAGALETAILVSEEEKPLLGHLEDVRRAREIDERGLARMDFEYLAILERSGGPVGEQNLLNLMRTVDKDRVLNEIEPFLVRLDFIRHGPRGRELTNDGRDYLLAHRVRASNHR